MEDKTHITIRSYDQNAQQYCENTKFYYPRDEQKLFLSLVPAKSLILDAGCGFGRDAKTFIENGHNVIGIDLSKELLNLAKSTEPRLKTKLMDVRKIDFPDNYFDAIWSSAVIHHIPREDVVNVIKTFNRILKKDGICYTIVREGKGTGMVKDKLIPNSPRFFTYFQQKELREIFQHASFEIIDCHIYNEDKQFKSGRDVNYIALFAKKLTNI